MSATRSAARPFGLLTLGLRTALSGSSWIVLDRLDRLRMARPSRWTLPRMSRSLTRLPFFDSGLFRLLPAKLLIAAECPSRASSTVVAAVLALVPERHGPRSQLDSGGRTRYAR
ncbi:hypothetical protein M430DRAFT_20654 [Amorphotheca resinae ATCC 22711]|uniref:Uncharacterized protein n=1 Tax=Amorphotheca resinae ATCC 22711 TaxID=857342 RepID=A0A2T3AZ77_AMORE|nr:hypothetical protein M430DRAFT_20654 [Amorphotheca resinae ATCC 22711]PSS15369.1 hypothetical protein M430DRAFT_20654 [Amorphotheca resinae ATCC 22711]